MFRIKERGFKMVAFNFKSYFADDVESGRKPGSIRQKKKCEVGDKIQLYTGQRTKKCRKLGEAICTGVCRIRVTEESPWTMFETEGEIETSINGRSFYEIEGFENSNDFVDFFRRHYGLPFNGYYHQWAVDTQSD